jgi:hypothetical protein
VSKSTVILFALLLGGLNCISQTNPQAACPGFSLPPPQLRPLGVQSDSSNSVADAGNYTNSFSQESPETVELQKSWVVSSSSFAQSTIVSQLPVRLTLDTQPGEADLRTYRLLAENGYWNRPSPQSDNVFVRVVNDIFEPATFRVGKTTVACSIVTALKKKNPLCLLNPIVLNVSW